MQSETSRLKYAEEVFIYSYTLILQGVTVKDVDRVN